LIKILCWYLFLILYYLRLKPNIQTINISTISLLNWPHLLA